MKRSIRLTVSTVLLSLMVLFSSAVSDLGFGSLNAEAGTVARKYQTLLKKYRRYKPGPVDTDGAVMGIDVSAWQGSIDFRKVKEDGVNFVIIRIGHGRSVDQYFESNYKKAKKAGLKVGGYWYSTALSAGQAAAQRKLCLRTIQGKKFEMPVFIDIEDLPQLRRGPALTTVVIKDFCKAVARKGYKAGFYTSRSFVGRFISRKTARNFGYVQWIAEWGTKNNYGYSYNFWQFGTGRVKGIHTPVDVDFYFPAEEEHSDEQQG